MEVMEAQEFELESTPIPFTCPDIIQGLRQISTLDGLTDEEFMWIARNGQEQVVEDGEIIFSAGQSFEHLVFLLEGEMHIRRPGGSLTNYVGRAGQITGKIPYSRMKRASGEGFAKGRVRAVLLHESLFPALLQAIPSMTERCVHLLIDRVREWTRVEQQADKLAALGKLAANLSHELKNPASAARSAANSLSQELRRYGGEKFKLGALNLAEDEKQAYAEWVECIVDQMHSVRPEGSDNMDSADREDLFTAWLVAHNIPEPWLIAPTLSHTPATIAQMDEIAAKVPGHALPILLSSFAAGLRAESMTDTVVDATARIFDLITAIQDYSYMDQALIQEIDLVQSLEATLAMFTSRLSNIRVERAFAPVMPPVAAYGSELNQVWTELIENAIEAMPKGGTLTLRASVSGSMVFVEICDSGHGISDEVRCRMFEPFFTTKPIGAGLGLGLDNAQRIVSKHGGSIGVLSKPSDTCIQVKIPIEAMGAY